MAFYLLVNISHARAIVMIVSIPVGGFSDANNRKLAEMKHIVDVLWDSYGCFRRPQNLRNHLVRAKVNTLLNFVPPLCGPGNRPRCKLCSLIPECT